MKEAARPKHLDKRPADINKALLQVLVLARNEYKYAVRVKTELSELPPVACHIGQLSKIFLALIVNFTRAIVEARGQQVELAEITVRTAHKADAAWIEIENADAGFPGKNRPQHPPSVEEHIPCSPEVPTAKHGLEMARSIIVDDHSGELTFEIGTGYGTAFLIRLPVDGKSLGQIGV
jgi:nitrogen-specific signal transduction histidine kinase